MANMRDEYVKVVEIAMRALYEAGPGMNHTQTIEEQWRIFKDALEKISPCSMEKYYKARGGKFPGECTLDNIASDYVHAGDFEEITEEEFNIDEDEEDK